MAGWGDWVTGANALFFPCSALAAPVLCGLLEPSGTFDPAHATKAPHNAHAAARRPLSVTAILPVRRAKAQPS